MRNFIFGTDWWTDCDDLAALRILTRAHKNREINLLGVGINAAMEYSAASVDGFLRLDGLEDIPLGIDLEATDFEGTHLKYQKNLAPFSKRFRRNEDAEDAVKLYRRLLSESDTPVHIVEVGFLQVFSQLLLSEADEYSPLSGAELVKEKVSKVWVMAGKWDEEGSTEHNFCNNARSRAAAHIFCEKCPVPVTFLGFEVGIKVISGNELSENDHLYKAFCDHGSKNGRYSWDPLTALLAVTGDEEKAGYKTVTGKAAVDPETGKNYFTENEAGLHKYVIPLFPASYYEEKINERIN